MENDPRHDPGSAVSGRINVVPTLKFLAHRFSTLLCKSWMLSLALVLSPQAVVLTLAFLSAPVAAAEPDGASIISYIPQLIPNNLYPIQYNLPRVGAGFLAGSVALGGGRLYGTLNTLLGPLMGITSVLWVMMRCDPVIKPEWAWSMFGFWLTLFLTYITVEGRRVANRQLYIFLTLTLGGMCLCVTAMIYKSSVQSGFATIIPPCTSFAAYAVAFFYPDRPRLSMDLPI